jgi:hypothetical protein
MACQLSAWAGYPGMIKANAQRKAQKAGKRHAMRIKRRILPNAKEVQTFFRNYFIIHYYEL